MSWTLRITRALLDDIRADLRRPHPFAAERVGFVHCRLGNEQGGTLLVLPFGYVAVPDSQYVRDGAVGARISGDAIRDAMGAALAGALCVLHVHLHEHAGRPHFSRTDLREYPPLISALQNAGPMCPHGALLLSDDHLDCLLWRRGRVEPLGEGRIVVAGRPMGFFIPGGVYA